MSGDTPALGVKTNPEDAEDKAAAAAMPSEEIPLAQGKPPHSGDKPAPEPDYYSQLLLLKAEFENYRKRVDREKPEYYRSGKAEIIFRLIPLYDLLLQAHQQILAAHEDTPLAKGMEGIFKEFDKIFKEENVTVMEPLGKPFDAYRHEVLGTVEQEGAEEGGVVEVLQNGFMLGEKVLRTAKVRVAKKK